MYFKEKIKIQAGNELCNIGFKFTPIKQVLDW